MVDNLEHRDLCLWNSGDHLLPLTISFGIALIIGCLILAAGIGHLFFAFQTGSVDGFLWQTLLSVLYVWRQFVYWRTHF